MAAAPLGAKMVLFAFLFLLTNHKERVGAQFYGGPFRPSRPQFPQIQSMPAVATNNEWNSGPPGGNVGPNQPETGNRPPFRPQTGSVPQTTTPAGSRIHSRNPARFLTRNTVCPTLVLCRGLQRCYREGESAGGCPVSTTCCSFGFNSIQGMQPNNVGCCVPN